ncbi:50S ribosomal protein L5 [Candidatus Micrarchaeota archaeon]|nr:50S ribosomal protein L5 [Candidatus Micrarchaeota archaeon]
MGKMQEVRLDKVTLNIGAGGAGEKLENAKSLLERITGKKAVVTFAKTRNPTFKIKKGDEIGVKVTLRGMAAEELLKKSLDAVDSKLVRGSFSREGGFSFGVREYIDFPGIKYDPKIGMIGFDVSVSLKKPGLRVRERRIASREIPRKQRVSTEEAVEFMKNKYGVEIIE